MIDRLRDHIGAQRRKKTNQQDVESRCLTPLSQLKTNLVFQRSLNAESSLRKRMKSSGPGSITQTNASMLKRYLMVHIAPQA
jgi:hypothetical protein